ncbi:hypothetical protein ACHAWF_003539 [Thalassiosira exigua]
MERQGKPRTPLIGSDAVKQFRKKVCALEARGTSIQVQYGCRWVAKQATAMCLSGIAVSRTIDNQLFLVPPRAACDERVNDDSLNNWRRQLLYPADRNKVLFPACVHNERDEKHYHLYCLEYEAEAKTRLDAVSRESVALSIDEALDMRGQAAIYCNSSDEMSKIKTWKNYGVEGANGCERRKYCSEKCQLDDWTLHKLECKKAVEANPRIDDQNASDRGTGIDPLMKYSLDVKEGDDAVVHGLKAKPQYNGMVGPVGAPNENGRFTLTLRLEIPKTISIKPENLYNIGVFCRKRKKKS